MAENVRGAHFDESLTRLVAAVAQVAGNDRAECSVYHRDTTGRVSVVLSGLVNPEVVERIIEVAKAEVGGYLRDDYPVRTESDIGALRILNEGLTAPVVRVDEFKVRFIDRRVAGADWLVASGDRASGIPRVTFASIKGGVGRSTALAVVAAHLSRSGKRVIAIDLDLEAPGIGTMLVVAGATSDFGALDYLVDSGVQNPSLLRASDYIAGSFLGETGAAVSIMPAIGTSTLKSPENAIAKLSRVYIEASEEGDGKLYHERVRDLLDRLAESGQYDVILIDARAGLHESTAAAISVLRRRRTPVRKRPAPNIFGLHALAFSYVYLFGRHV
ncbi:P-loop NTPase [Sphingomonas aerolata]|uniref:KGGVGR-motif variant AAA ATPase n=1 Tax=Sphingomonas aerolata TaxID=185951 RepID=UPI002FE1E924